MKISRPYPIGRSGFNLVELSISLGLLSVIGLIISQFSASAFGFFSNTQKSMQINDSFELLRLTLATQCTPNLKGKALSLNNMSGAGLPSISSFAPDLVTPLNPVLQTGSTHNGLLIQNIQLLPKVQVNTSLILAELQVNFSSQGGGALQNVLRTLPIFAQVDSDKVSSCWLRPDTANMISSNEICIVASNSQLDYFDPATNSCTRANASWHSGSTASATCPTGTVLPIGATPGYFCKGGPPSGFSDSFATTPITFSIGGTQPKRRPYVMTTLNNASATCNCHWATDLATSSAFRCQILCAQK